MKKAVMLMLIICAGCSQHSFSPKGGMLLAEFKVKDAGQVSFYHSSDGFAENKTELSDGKWRASVKQEEHFTYFLTVDGKVFLPDCGMKQQDDFGGEICIYERKQ
ncbi:MAG: hypothetical protein LRY50_02770 [Geovibrio sp.]|uniref:hypothetical protein n=1 Tax=Geovibrio ferrireducens TaxID=46201 RepID=UPI002247DB66|nr:hypothetical protein [Geovibrio ferrireducens]MCD8492099.1 hypothetical protein [Geovibrio sp.]MCD8567310.1 hypothetical protein [Geovibrio sp.]